MTGGTAHEPMAWLPLHPMGERIGKEIDVHMETGELMLKHEDFAQQYAHASEISSARERKSAESQRKSHGFSKMLKSRKIVG